MRARGDEFIDRYCLSLRGGLRGALSLGLARERRRITRSGDEGASSALIRPRVCETAEEGTGETHGRRLGRSADTMKATYYVRS